ncbi:MAG TPA: EF-hand domain-containing protein [Acidisphaera sp.]|nr:EF-hand domain-containing protein [Acidisphaera sp.]
MRILTLASVIGLAAAQTALAQQAAAPPLVPPTPASTTDGPARHMTVRERFALANTTHDGKLTLDQAKAGFPAMARLFDVIDRDRHGYITMDDIKAYYDAKRARQAAAQPTTETPH